ncbi:MAG: Cof-type HAD-IIB family hydrolase [Ruminococcaceae bacterium]|nr:Cof-type HAD-IIB family hydrolase [Oscillospiraceae bacterium]
MNRFKNVLIVTDLDGTLLNSQKNIDVRTREAMDYFMAEGGSFTFATGRLVASFEGVRKKLKWNAPVVFANGSQIYDYSTEKLLWECDLPDSERAYLQTLLNENPGTCLEVYRHMHCSMVNLNDISRRHARGFGFGFEEKASLEEVEGNIAKVLFTNEHSVLEGIRDRIEAEKKNLNVRFSNDVFLEVFSADTDKGRGTLMLAELLGIDKKDIYTAGDQENDLDLLGAAEIAFAPENAVNSVKAAADIILPDNDSDTIAALIEHLCTRYPL